MKIKSLQLKNFKRFTDLTLQDIPENAKLVLLIGSNGSGKSSVFDGFEAVNKGDKSSKNKTSGLFFNDAIYYRKNIEKDFDISVQFYDDAHVTLTDNAGNYHKLPYRSFYGRSAVRYLPKLTKTPFGDRY